MDKLDTAVGVEALIIGSGPTGLILAQLLKLNGAMRVVVAANKGIKMDIAKQLEAGDEYVELDRDNPSAQWEELKQKNPYGFDVVVCAHSPIFGSDVTDNVTTLGRGYGLGEDRKRSNPLCAQRWYLDGIWRVRQQCSRSLASRQDLRGRNQST